MAKHSTPEHIEDMPKKKMKERMKKMLGKGMARKAGEALLKRKSRLEQMESQLEGKSF